MTRNGECWPDLAGRLTGSGHVLPIRVYYEDTDFSGVVYHAGYLRFMERGRSDFLRLLGIGHAELATRTDGPLAFAVRRMVLDFLAAARIDDMVEVETRMRAVGGASLTLTQSVRRGDAVLVHAEVLVALIGGNGRPRRWPGDIAAALRAVAQS